MDPKKIIVITFSLSNNGAERVFTELSNEWARQGHSVTVLQFERNAYGSESFELDPKVDEITLGYKHIANKFKRYFLYLKEVRKYLKEHDDATVIAFSFTTQVIVSIASVGLKNRIIFSERNDPNSCPYSKVTRAIRNLSYYRATYIVFQTEDAKNYFSKRLQNRGIIIANPINPFLPSMYYGERRKTIMTAARLRPQKNISLLINAFALFTKEFPEYKLEIYGIGEELEKLTNLVASYNLSDRVFFKGFCKDINDKMRDVAMYVCSSDYEGISNSMLEALAMGVATISTDCPIGGARQVIRSYENGILVPVRDETALYKAMSEVAGDKNLSQRLSENGYKVREEYKVDKIALQWVNYID